MHLNWIKREPPPPLDLPEPAISRHPHTLTDSRELESWLSELPVASPRRQALALQRQLGFLASDPEPPRHLGRLLNLFHPSIATLQQTGRDFLEISPQLLTSEQRGLLQTLPGLFEELAIAHMRAVRLALDTGRQPEPEDLYHAMLMSMRLLQWRLLGQQRLRPGLWRQMLQLQQLAEWTKAAHQTLPSPLATPEDPRDCNGLFLGALLLLLSDSYRHPRSCTESLFRSLPRLVGALCLAPADEQAGGIPLEPAGERLPLDFARRAQDIPATHRLVVTQLQSQLPELLPEDECGLRLWLASDLRALQEGRCQRRHPREPSQQRYRAVVGLDAVHARLRALQQTPIEGLPPMPQNAIACRQHDLSLGGAGFVLSADTPPPHCGDWLLFEAEERPGSGFVATMCRRLVDDNGEQHIGVERLTGQVIPVTLGHGRKPGLLHAQPQQSEFRLLAPSGHFRGTGTEETLAGRQRDYRIRQLERLSRRDNDEVIRVVLLA